MNADSYIGPEDAPLFAEVAAEETLPPVRLDPILWAPPFAPVKPPRDPAYVEYRRANRAYRRAFGRGERHRKILLAVGAANALRKDRS